MATRTCPSSWWYLCTHVVGMRYLYLSALLIVGAPQSHMCYDIYIFSITKHSTIQFPYFSINLLLWRQDDSNNAGVWLSLDNCLEMDKNFWEQMFWEPHWHGVILWRLEHQTFPWNTLLSALESNIQLLELSALATHGMEILRRVCIIAVEYNFI